LTTLETSWRDGRLHVGTWRQGLCLLDIVVVLSALMNVKSLAPAIYKNVVPQMVTLHVMKNSGKIGQLNKMESICNNSSKT